jgi:hypothetical protein
VERIMGKTWEWKSMELRDNDEERIRRSSEKLRLKGEAT